FRRFEGEHLRQVVEPVLPWRQDVAEATRVIPAVGLDRVARGAGGKDHGAQHQAVGYGQESAQRTTQDILLQEFPGSLPSRPWNICPRADLSKRFRLAGDLRRDA